MNPSDGERLNRIMGGALETLVRLKIPVIAAINGDAIGGGCEIATACDLRLAASNARFRFAQAQVGLTTGWGGTSRLVRLLAATKSLIRAATYLPAADANQIESQLFNELWLSADHLEALTAFKEKRDPQFRRNSTEKGLD
jgi:enoyl-CoA hydratase/carnithine racemase